MYLRGAQHTPFSVLSRKKGACRVNSRQVYRVKVVYFGWPLFRLIALDFSSSFGDRVPLSACSVSLCFDVDVRCLFLSEELKTGRMSLLGRRSPQT